MDIIFNEVPGHRFAMDLLMLSLDHDKIREHVSSGEELLASGTGKFFMTEDGLTGFGIDGSKIIGVFNASEEKRGGLIAAQAIIRGGRQLVCSAGFLVDFWSRFSFVETGRFMSGGKELVNMSFQKPVR